MKRKGKKTGSIGGAETKAERFRRVGERRVGEVLRLMRLIGNLSNRNNYQYSDEEVQQMMAALDVELRRLKQRFRYEGGPSGNGFAFKK